MKIILYSWIDHLKFKNKEPIHSTEAIRAIHSTIGQVTNSLFLSIYCLFVSEKSPRKFLLILIIYLSKHLHGLHNIRSYFFRSYKEKIMVHRKIIMAIMMQNLKSLFLLCWGVIREVFKTIC
jgi:hypothetical protein